MKTFKHLIDLVIPSRCAICDVAGEDLCPDCRVSLKISVREELNEEVRFLSVIDYDQAVSKLLVSFKEKSQASLANELAKLMLPALDWLPQIPEPIYFVPAPSRDENFVLRGFVPSLLLAQALVKLSPIRFKILDCLRFTRRVRDQVGLDAASRKLNLYGSMSLNQQVSGKICVIVDDVITTGATVLEARRLLVSSGAMVPAALAFSSTAS